MRYENRWNDRDRDYRREQSRDDYGQADFSDNRRHRHEREDRDEDEHRAWRPFGETGPTRYGGRGGYDMGQQDRYDRSFGGGSDRSFGDYDRGYDRGGYDRGRSGRGYGAQDQYYGVIRGRDRDEGGFGETGGRFSDSYRHEQYGRRDQWGSNPRGGSGNDERSWLDKASDKVQAFFGDDDAQRRSQWDDDRSGAHRGRGPKGYRRSDERIRDEVSDRLSDDSWLDASDIEVRVESGEVTLTGHVSSRDDKRRAEDLAERVSGVDHVQNNLRVKREGDRSGSVFGSTPDDFGTTGGSGRA